MSEFPAPVRVAIFASGQGSNAREIIRYFRSGDHPVAGRPVEIACIASNRPGAGVVEIAHAEGIPVLLLDREVFFRGGNYLGDLQAAGVDFVVLAGFLWKIPPELVSFYDGRIVNIHPALLPGYGGKGMYGQAVHAAVIAAGDAESGISIHEVDRIYDHGRLLFQARCPVLPGDTAETLAGRIHNLEHRHYPEQIARWMETKLSLNQ